MAMERKSIHETVLRDIFDIAKGLKDEDEIKRITNYNNRASFKSINTRSEALTLVFPCIASRNCDYQSAAMGTKAIERKAVSLLTMLFAAIQITDANDAFDYIKKFHTNLNTSFSVDDFLHAMDGFVESHVINNGLDDVAIMEAYERIKEDMRESLNCYFEFTDISESSVGDFKVVNVNGQQMIRNTCPVQEADIPRLTNLPNIPYNLFPQWNYQTNQFDNVQVPLDRNDPRHQEYLDQVNAINATNKNAIELYKLQQQKEDDLARATAAQAKETEERNDSERRYQHMVATDRENQRLQSQKNNIEMQKLINSVNQNRLLDQDVKKANELQPTLMLVNFISKGNADSSYPIYSSFVVGVKAKLYVVDGNDIFNRFKIKSNEKNLTLNLVKLGTREISFFKDFLFAIDNAKLDAVSQSRRGSSNKIWKVLERRAMKSKIRRSFNMINDATSITSIIVTSDEVEFFRKTEYIDLENPRVMRNIMEAYNLLNFVIMDDNVEVAKFLTDSGDDVYELITYNHLEKEQKDNTKKILNLMSKMR